MDGERRRRRLISPGMSSDEGDLSRLTPRLTMRVAEREGLDVLGRREAEGAAAARRWAGAAAAARG
jgi:hypothetical protein